MHPAVYMTLTKVLIKSDARHSSATQSSGQHLAVLLHSQNNAVLIFDRRACVEMDGGSLF